MQQTDLRTPTPHLASLSPSQDSNIPTSSTSIARPPVVRQPTSSERVGVAVGEEDDLEARRLKYVVLFLPCSKVLSPVYSIISRLCWLSLCVVNATWQKDYP